MRCAVWVCFASSRGNMQWAEPTLYISGRADRKTRFAPVCCGRSFVSFCRHAHIRCHCHMSI